MQAPDPGGRSPVFAVCLGHDKKCSDHISAETFGVCVWGGGKGNLRGISPSLILALLVPPLLARGCCLLPPSPPPPPTIFSIDDTARRSPRSERTYVSPLIFSATL